MQLCFHFLTFQTGSHFSLFVKSSTALLTFSVISMDENAEVLSDSLEPFRVRRYRRRRQLQEVLPVSAATFYAVEGPPAESTVIPVHEITEEDDLAANSEALCIPHDPLIPAAQSDSNLFDESALAEFSGFLPDSNALPLQDQVPSVPRCLVQHDSGVSVSGALSAELASTVPFSVVMGPPSSEQTTQTEVSGALLRSAWSTGKSVSRSRSRGPSLTLEPGCPKPPPVHPLRATGATTLWNPLARPVPSSRGHYASYPSASSLTTVPKAMAAVGSSLQAVPKKAQPSIRACSLPGHHLHSPGHVVLNLGKGQRSTAFPKQTVQEGSTNLVSSTSIHSKQWKKALLLWKDLALSIASASTNITEILASPMCDTLLEHLLRRVSDTTALRYIATCTKVIDSIIALSLPLADPTQVQLLDAVFAMQRSFRGDPGVHSDNVLKALRWLVKAALLENWPDLCDGLFATTSWRTLSPKKESVPLPLAFLLWLETCILFDSWPARKTLLAGAVLLCVYASLRFSDAQHIDFSSIVLDSSSLRAGSFRTKTSHIGCHLASTLVGSTPAHCSNLGCLGGCIPLSLRLSPFSLRARCPILSLWSYPTTLYLLCHTALLLVAFGLCFQSGASCQTTSWQFIHCTP